MPPNHTPRIILFIFLGVAVLAVSVAVYLLSPGLPSKTNDNILISSIYPSPEPSPRPTSTMIDTSEWETYQSQEYDYEIKYPKGAIVIVSDSGISFGISIKEYLNVPENLNKEVEASGYPFGIGVSIISDNIKIGDSNPCTWYFTERENFDIMDYDPTVCDKGMTHFKGIPAYIHERDRDGTNGGLFAVKSHTIVFFHNGRPWEIRYSGLPSNPTPEWKAHPYYQYLEQSVPITQAIIQSFRFVE